MPVFGGWDWENVQYLMKGIPVGKPEIRRVLTIMLPAMLELVLSQFFGMADTIMLGNSAGSTVAIAAVGLTNTPFNLFNGMLTALNVGTTAAVAWAIGAGKPKDARSVTRTAIFINLAIGALVTLLLYAFAGPVITLMRAEEDTFEPAVQYLRVIAVGIAPMTMTYAVTGALRGAGHTKLPMLYNLVANFLNVLGNYALIYGKLGFPEMGVLGAGISTTASRCVGLALSLLTLCFAPSPLKPARGDDKKPRLDWTKRIFRVGGTASLEQLVMQLGFMAFSVTVASLGTATFAAHQIALSISGLVWTPAQAFGVAAIALVGQSLGAGEPIMAKNYMRMIHRMSLVAAVFIAAIFVFFPEPIARLYTPDVATAVLAAGALRMIALGMPGICTQLPVASALRGAGDTVFPLIASAVGIWTFRVFVAPIFVNTLGMGLNGAWLSIALDQLARATVVYLRFLQGGWMRKKVLS